MSSATLPASTSRAATYKRPRATRASPGTSPRASTSPRRSARSAPRRISAILRAGRIALSVNGAIRQQGDLSDMILDTAGIIAELSRYVRLEAGDLIFTGTPEGVGPLIPGDVADGEIENVGSVRVEIAG